MIRGHVDVKDVAVIGVPSEKFGQVPKAFIVKASADLKSDSIHAFLKDVVADYKLLRGGIEFVDIIPKSLSGKILKKNLQSLKNK